MNFGTHALDVKYWTVRAFYSRFKCLIKTRICASPISRRSVLLRSVAFRELMILMLIILNVAT